MKKFLSTFLLCLSLCLSYNLPILAQEETEQNVSQESFNTINELARPSNSGKLYVSGTDLVNEKNQVVQLKGLSTHGIGWYPTYINQDFFTQMSNEWKCNVVRLAMYTQEYNGYCSNNRDLSRDDLKNLIKNGIQYAAKADMYVIVDFHFLNDVSYGLNLNSDQFKSEANEFFSSIASWVENNGYSDYVLYEICNEPNNGTSWSDVKEYADYIIPIIRNIDSKSVIIVGTPTWSQDVDTAANDPLSYSNIMYALHFYAATHTDWIRSKLTSAHNAGLPIFVSEYGLCDSSGSGSNDYSSSSSWMNLLDSYNISSCMWNISNKAETSSIILSSCTKSSNFTSDDLTETGKWFLNNVTNSREEMQAEVTLEGYSLSLSNQIGVNFYYSMNELAESEKVSVMVNGETLSLTKNSLGDYVGTYYLPIKNITDTLNAVVNINDEEYDSNTYTISQYADYILENYEVGSNEYTIVKSLLTYGYYAATYFDYNTSSLESIVDQIQTLNIKDFSEFKYTLLDSNDSVSFIGARLVLKSLPQLKLYFKGNDDFYVDEQKVTTITEGNYTVITIDNVSDLYTPYTITTDNFRLDYSVASYGYCASSKELSNLLYAMFAYYDLFVC